MLHFSLIFSAIQPVKMQILLTIVDEEENVMESAFSIWFLIGAALVFFMQCGFAMVETGFTRAKNAGNIIMKNTMDFCLGTVAFIFVGYKLLFGNDIGGFLGWGGGSVNIFNFASCDWSNFVFNLVFCATAATIVSGAMAERTKFISYCIYSFVISLFIYPIEAHWVWGGGWLSQMGYVDFAGSSAIHMVGGISALIGAAFLGPRIGKFNKDGKPNAIPGHSITLGALGVFILWFGWYGFNGAAATDITQLAQIFATTTLAPAFATCTVMIITWIKNGKPDVGMTLNGALAGLVAITAGCSNVDCVGAIIIGIISGFIVVGVVKLLDYVLKVDDPVGAVAVHGACGMFGTIAVGFFNIYEDAETGLTKGLFYGGGLHQLGVQCLGVLSIAVWTAVTITILFIVLKKTVGIRASEKEEIEGLDIHEHGCEAYANFMLIHDK